MTANPFVTDFVEQLKHRFARDQVGMSYSDWVIENTTLQRRPFTLTGYEFQRQILDDMHPNLAVLKCSQVGLTELQLRKFAAFLTRNPGTNGIFSLPNDDMARRVSQTRLGPMIEADKVFNVGTDRPIRRTDLFQLNQSFAFLVGGNEGAATSINADIVFHDEVDLSDQELLALFQSRLQGSKFRITQGFSTPTFEGFGIHASFSASDQHQYLTKCQHCGAHNTPTWTPDHVHLHGVSSDLNSFLDIDADMAAQIDFNQSYVLCRSCHRPLDLSDPTRQEWVAKYPGRRSRGYAVTPFCTPRLTIDYILDQQMKYQTKGAIRRFYNTVLGLPYSDDKARLTEAEIRAVMNGSERPNISPTTPVVIGIDVGLVCHIVLIALTSPHPVAFHWVTVPEFNLVNEIENLTSTYNIVGGCIDRYPYTPLSNEVRDLHAGKIMPVEYTTTSKGVVMVKDEFGNPSHVQGHRTGMIDEVATDIRKRRIEIAGYGSQDSLIIQHLRDMVRVETSDDRANWQKLTNTDHYFHAFVYAKFAMRVHDLKQSWGMGHGSLFAATVVSTENHNEAPLGVKAVRHNPISLGSI